MRIPFVDLTREWGFFEKPFLEKFKEFGRSGNYVLGKYTEEFEKHFADFCGFKYAVGVSTGLSALEILLRAYEIGPGDEVITVGNSAVATSLAISCVGAKPIFCDISDDFLINADAIEAHITPKTKAILPVHLFGDVCDMEKINAVAKKHNLIVIEDACQAHGANFSGAASLNSKAFSFYPTKNLGALGEGGLIITNNKAIADFAKAFRNYGQEGRYNHVIKGSNYRIDSLHAALLDVKLPHLANFVEKRRAIATRYINTLSGQPGLIINKLSSDSSCHLFVIRVLDGKRDALRAYLESKEIDALVHYPTAIHRQPCYIDEYKNLVLKNTDALQDEILSLPCYPFLSEEEQNDVIENVITFFGVKV